MTPVVIAAVLSATAAIFAWRRRPAAGAVSLALLGLAVAEWSLLNALELAGIHLPAKIACSRLEYLGILALPVAWLAFALQYSGRGKWLTWRNLVLLSLFPVGFLILLWTNDHHRLIWVDVGPNTGLGAGLAPTYGVLFWLHVVYDYFLLGAGAVLLFRALFRSPRLYRGQIIALLIGALAPLVGNVLYITGLSPWPDLDLTPFAFTITNVAVVGGFFRFRLLDIVPVARDALIESMSDGVIVLDARNRIVDVNPVAEEIVGRPGGEVVGQPARQVLSAWPDLIERYRDVTEAQAEIAAGEGEAQRYLDLRISSLHDRRGRFTGRLIVLRDISARKRAEEALHGALHKLERRNQQLAQILDMGNSFRLDLDVDSLFQKIVQAAYDFLGFGVVVLSIVDQDSGQFRVRAYVGLEGEGFPGSADQPTWEEFSRVLQERFRRGRCYFIPEGAYDWEETAGPLVGLVGSAEGRPGEEALWQPHDALIVPVELREGQVVGTISVNQPLDGRRPSTETFQLLEIFANQVVPALENAWLYTQLQQELDDREQAALELQEAKEAAEAANRAKSTFLANMSHELRTPLSAIIGYSELLREEAYDRGYSALLDDLEKIQAAGSQLLAIISDVLDLSKIEAGRMELNLEEVDLADLIEDVVTTSLPLAVRNDNTLTVDYPDDIGHMFTDPTKVRQILLNLLSNAAKFTHQGAITFSARRELASLEEGSGAEWVCFCVTDSGIGMTEEQMQLIFGAFIQAESSTTRRYGGSGLGLAISRHFCQLMGGQIHVESQLGKGSTFTVYLPVEGVGLPKEQPPEAAEIPPFPREPTVLVIDDDSASRELISRYLTRDGFRIETAADGLEGLRLAQELRPDAIILDVKMPQMDGWAVLAALKATPKLADIPVVMATIMDDQSKGFALGASDYITKPIDRYRLSQLLQRYCRVTGRVLLVEDTTASREVLRRLLEKQGWEVDEAANGRIALMRVAEGRPDLILLDLMMPEMDGFEFLIELRKNPDWQSIPVVVITAKDLTLADQQRLDGYVDQVLQKGAYDLDDLLRQVRGLLIEKTR